MINTYIPYFKKKDQNILKQCLKTNFVSTVGPLVKKFENNFSKKYNFNYSVALNSGTSALHLGLKAIGIKNGDSVILPSYTFAATANTIIYNNAYPWFFDCDKNFDLPIDEIEKILKAKTYFRNKNLVIKKNNSIVRAIMPVSTFGKKLEFDKLIKFSEKYNLKILFDTAACHDPKIFNFKKNNKMHFCFSFNGNKTLTTGAGGIFASNSKKIINKVKILANVGKKINKYDYDEVGFNYKMTNLQASLGLSQLKNLKNILLKKKKSFKIIMKN
jgi:perosamine synthetase